ncbi:MAG: hypothetical protein F6K26_30860 [Moorea sp. SIO2I5]|nr:hypothetical protein [Moorena sp. SIO2I5]
MNIAFPSKRQVNLNFFPCLDAVAHGQRLHPYSLISTPYSLLPTPDYRLPITDYRLPITDSRLPALY